MGRSEIARCAKAGVAYFALVFGAGFLLAFIRIPVLEPRLGTRWAELAEMPVMGVAMVLAARFVVARFAIAPAAGPRLAMGVIALALLLAAEFGGVLALRGLTIADYFATRDPVSGVAYYLMLIAFALLPWGLPGFGAGAGVGQGGEPPIPPGRIDG